jgi:uncharacterized membrane protein
VRRAALLLACLAGACAGTPVHESLRAGATRLEAAGDRLVTGFRTELERTHEAASTLEGLLGPRQGESAEHRRTGPTSEADRLESAGATAADLWRRELLRLDPPAPPPNAQEEQASSVLLR